MTPDRDRDERGALYQHPRPSRPRWSARRARWAPHLGKPHGTGHTRRPGHRRQTIASGDRSDPHTPW